MTLRAVLVAASGGTASNGAVELACRLAKRFEAHLEGFHVRSDPHEILAMAGDGYGLPLVNGWVDEITKVAAELSEETRISFHAACFRHGLPRASTPARTGASATWEEETGYAPYLVSQRARFFDLVVLGRSDRVIDRPYSDTVEETLLRSGRPVLLAPADPPATVGETIALGWNGSPEAVRALKLSLPLLTVARAVAVITVRDGERQVSVDDVLEYLAWHGAAARHCDIYPIPGVGTGQQLLAAARDEGADLLVMGGYGHKPWRELLFGGATREIVGISLLPLLLSH